MRNKTVPGRNAASKASSIMQETKMDEDISIESPKYGKANVAKEAIRHTEHITPLVQTLFENFFNIIKNNDAIASTMRISDIQFYTSGAINHCDSLKISSLHDTNRIAIFKFKDRNFSFCFTWEKSWDQTIRYYVNISSKEEISMDGPQIYNTFFQLALDVSDLKGKCVDLKQGVHWEQFSLKKTTFDDVFVPDAQLHDCKMFLDVFNKNDNMLRYLMVGPPGTCKTDMSTAICNEALQKGVTIIKIAIDKHMSECVQFASYLSPAIILLDDIDLMLGSRTSGGYSQNLGIFLDVMDGAKKIAKNVGFLATTNSNHLLDMAAQRPGRFHRILNFSKINKDNVKNVIKKSLRQECNIVDDKTVKAFTHERIVDLLHGENKTGAYIYNVVHMLVLRAQSFNVDITTKWLESEIRNDITSLDDMKKSRVMSDKMENDKVSGGGMGFSTESDESPESV